MLLQLAWGPERLGEAWLVWEVVKRLRRKLGDSAAASLMYVITQPMAGYRMPVGETRRARNLIERRGCNRPAA